jgi:cellulose synthase/poly-beta-1,6-N-acetylglucosamine synthase-like glycosyltransferase
LNVTGTLFSGLLFFPLCADSVLRFALLCLRFLVSGKCSPSLTQNHSGCVVLIAACNEAGVIAETVRELMPQLSEWPGSRLCVIADHCTDATAAEAAQAGAGVAIRNETSAVRSGKGAAIDWWLTHCSAEWKAHEFIVILDADSRFMPGSLSALRKAISDGADAAQAFVKPVTDTTSGRLAGWSEILMQQIDDTARSRCGWQVPLRGTGMAIRAELLAQLSPKLHTLAEDLELDMLLAARGARVDFVADAVLLDPKPAESSGASRQRARWLRGQLQVISDYLPEILRALLSRGLSAWFLIPLLLLRPKVAFIALRILTAGILLLILLMTENAHLQSGLKPGILILLVGLCLDFFYYLSAAFVVDNRRDYLRDLLSAPRYVLMWMVGAGLMVVKKGWLRVRE